MPFLMLYQCLGAIMDMASDETLLNLKQLVSSVIVWISDGCVVVRRDYCLDSLQATKVVRYENMIIF